MLFQYKQSKTNTMHHKSFHSVFGDSEEQTTLKTHETIQNVKQTISRLQFTTFFLPIIIVILLIVAAAYCIKYVREYKATFNRLRTMYNRIEIEPTLSQTQKQTLMQNHPFQQYLANEVSNGYNSKSIGLIVLACLCFLINFFLLYIITKKFTQFYNQTKRQY